MTEEMEKIETVTAEEADAGERVDKALAAKLPGLTRSVVQRLLAEGRVTLSGHPVPKNYKLRAGDTLEVAIPAPVEDEALPEDIALEDACKLEHDLSALSFEKIKAYYREHMAGGDGAN